jgi:cbb3-type cytochrome oxidase subunit 1
MSVDTIKSGRTCRRTIGNSLNEEVIQWQAANIHGPGRCTATPCRGWFALAAVLWGVVGMLVGVIIAAQLAWPELNFGIPWLSYGRLRPLHTNAVIFAFGGCALFATSYHVVQRTCQTRLFLPGLAAMFTFWGWQLVIVRRRSRCRWA